MYARGSTLGAHWQALRERYGAFEYRSSYFIANPPSKSAAVFERLRAQPPTSIGGCAVLGMRDLGTGVDTSQPGGGQRGRWLWGIGHGPLLLLRKLGTIHDGRKERGGAMHCLLKARPTLHPPAGAAAALLLFSSTLLLLQVGPDPNPPGPTCLPASAP